MKLAKGWYLIELVGHVRLAGAVTPCDEGGFLVERCDADGTVEDCVYVGPTAIFRMFPCTEVTAKATAGLLKTVVSPRPVWAADWVDKPAEPPPPKDPPALQVGDVVGIVDINGKADMREYVGALAVVGHPIGDRMVRKGGAVSPLNQTPRWIRRNNVTIWERAPGQYVTDTDDIPF